MSSQASSIGGFSLRDIGAQLIEYAERAEFGEGTALLTLPVRRSDSHVSSYNFARALYRLRQKRWMYFDECTLGEPAWDMLLDLFIAHHEKKKIRTTSLCLAASTPTTTGLRYIAMLEKRQLLVRSADEVDQRVTLVELTQTGFNLMQDFLSGVRTQFLSVLFDEQPDGASGNAEQRPARPGLGGSSP